MDVSNPYTGKVIQSIPQDNVETIEQKAHSARLAQRDWSHRPIKERVSIIEEFNQQLELQKQDLAQILTSEMGKPIGQSLNEINATIDRVKYFIDHCERLYSSEKVYFQDQMNENLTYEPLGVIANISAWNYPYFVGTNVFIPALIAGNSVLYKPSEFTTLTGLKISELMSRSGLQENIFVPIIGGGQEGQTLLEQQIDGVYFTGSYPTGLKIKQKMASQFVPVQLELGGKDPSYITDDTSVSSTAAAVADGAFYNTGQSCCAVERIYVHELYYSEFLGHFVDTVKGFKSGDPCLESTYLGPLTRNQQIDFLHNQVEEALKKGAKLLYQEELLEDPKKFFPATVLSEVNHEMSLMKDESFGPVIGIQPVKNDGEAVQLMNDTDFGLTASIYCRDSKRAESLLSQVNSGTVYQNCCDRVSPRLPWSGRQNSGMGWTLGEMGIMSFVRPKAWHLKSI